MMHPSGPPQATVAYQQAQCFGPLAQMYPMVGHRVMSPQPMGMVAATHTASYGDATHLPAQVYMLQGQGHQAASTGVARTPARQRREPARLWAGHRQARPRSSTISRHPPRLARAHLRLRNQIWCWCPTRGLTLPPHLMPHSPMVPPQLATAHFVHHQGV
ncbi:hypothetical protein MRX96_028800 [Rhipicephalus microplus]